RGTLQSLGVMGWPPLVSCTKPLDPAIDRPTCDDELCAGDLTGCIHGLIAFPPPRRALTGHFALCNLHFALCNFFAFRCRTVLTLPPHFGLNPRWLPRGPSGTARGTADRGQSETVGMYERFTDRARKVMQLANQESQRFNHEYIGTEHILLGLVKEGSGVAANVLKNLDIDLRKIRLEVEKIVQTGPGSEMVTMGKLPQTPRAKKVIEYSIEEARNLNHNYVGTEHLLLGLLREQEGVAAQVLMNLGLKLEDVREEVLNLLGHNMPET